MNAAETGILVFSDVDAALAGATRCEYAAAGNALRELTATGVECVLWSSATRAEIEHVLERLDARCSFVCEDGSAVFVPGSLLPFEVPGAMPAGDYQAFEFGRPHDEVLAVLEDVSGTVGVPLITFSEMTAADVANACSMSLAAAERAKRRDYGERFCLRSSDWETCAPLFTALAEAGVRALYDTPFHRAIAAVDRRQPFSLLRLLYRKRMGDVVTLAVIDDLGKQSPLAIADCIAVTADASATSAQWLPICLPAIASPVEWVETIGRIAGDVRTHPRRYLPFWRGL